MSGMVIPPTLFFFLKIAVTIWGFPQKLKVELPFDPAIPLLGLYPKNSETPKEPTHPNVHSSTIYNSQVLEAT